MVLGTKRTQSHNNLETLREIIRIWNQFLQESFVPGFYGKVGALIAYSEDFICFTHIDLQARKHGSKMLVCKAKILVIVNGLKIDLKYKGIKRKRIHCAKMINVGEGFS